MNLMDHAITLLEFSHIREMLCENAVSGDARGELARLGPSLSEAQCRRRMRETTEARYLHDRLGAPPLPAMQHMEAVATLCEKGAMLSPEQLEHVALFAVSCARMRAYLKRAGALGEAADVASWGGSICDLDDLRGEIERCVRGDAVLDSASSALRDIRRKQAQLETSIKKKLEDLLRQKKNCFSDGYAVKRNGHFVLPVRRECKNQIAGALIDVSGSGGTCFIEPAAVARMQEESRALEIEEDNEVRRVLYALTALVDARLPEIALGRQAMAALDVVFAKAKLSAQMDASPAEISADRSITLRGARHPLLRRETSVPLDFDLGGDVRGVVITGPNTGGKTVALKTVGLLSLMAQSGLHVPAAEARLCMNSLVLCDIGDGQSIAENLSTFSSHIRGIVEILRYAGPDTLVLLDELGSGTDPAEGMGIAVAVLDALRERGCLFVATTHYPEVKDYAFRTPGLLNARMAFDRESLSPLYRLELGEAGDSCALYIAQRLGLPRPLLERACREAYHGEREWTQGGADTARTAPPSLTKERAAPEQKAAFSIGDSVAVSPSGELGIVFEPWNARGEVGVQVKGEKRWIGYKRVRLMAPASELYPPDYDFSILFDTVENRKARHQMQKRHIPGLEITLDEGGGPNRA